MIRLSAGVIKFNSELIFGGSFVDLPQLNHAMYPAHQVFDEIPLEDSAKVHAQHDTLKALLTSDDTIIERFTEKPIAAVVWDDVLLHPMDSQGDYLHLENDVAMHTAPVLFHELPLWDDAATPDEMSPADVVWNEEVGEGGKCYQLLVYLDSWDMIDEISQRDVVWDEELLDDFKSYGLQDAVIGNQIQHNPGVFKAPVLYASDTHDVFNGTSHGISKLGDIKDKESDTATDLFEAQEQVESKSAAMSRICANLGKEGVSEEGKCKCSQVHLDSCVMYKEIDQKVVWDEEIKSNMDTQDSKPIIERVTLIFQMEVKEKTVEMFDERHCKDVWAEETQHDPGWHYILQQQLALDGQYLNEEKTPPMIKGVELLDGQWRILDAEQIVNVLILHADSSSGFVEFRVLDARHSSGDGMGHQFLGDKSAEQCINGSSNIHSEISTKASTTGDDTLAKVTTRYAEKGSPLQDGDPADRAIGPEHLSTLLHFVLKFSEVFNLHILFCDDAYMMKVAAEHRRAYIFGVFIRIVLHSSTFSRSIPETYVLLVEKDNVLFLCSHVDIREVLQIPGCLYRLLYQQALVQNTRFKFTTSVHGPVCYQCLTRHTITWFQWDPGIMQLVIQWTGCDYTFCNESSLWTRCYGALCKKMHNSGDGINRPGELVAQHFRMQQQRNLLELHTHHVSRFSLEEIPSWMHHSFNPEILGGYVGNLSGFNHGGSVKQLEFQMTIYSFARRWGPSILCSIDLGVLLRAVQQFPVLYLKATHVSDPRTVTVKDLQVPWDPGG